MSDLRNHKPEEQSLTHIDEDVVTKERTPSQSALVLTSFALRGPQDHESVLRRQDEASIVWRHLNATRALVAIEEPLETSMTRDLLGTRDAQRTGKVHTLPVINFHLFLSDGSFAHAGRRVVHVLQQPVSVRQAASRVSQEDRRRGEGATRLTQG